MTSRVSAPFTNGEARMILSSQQGGPLGESARDAARRGPPAPPLDLGASPLEEFGARGPRMRSARRLRAKR